MESGRPEQVWTIGDGPALLLRTHFATPTTGKNVSAEDTYRFEG